MAKKVTAKKTSRKRSAARKTAGRSATRRRKQQKTSAARTATRGASVRRKASSTVRGKTSRTARRKTAARAAATREERRNPTPDPRPSKLAVAATAVKGALAGAVAVVGDRLPWTQGDKPDGLALLESEHRRFEDLLKKGEETTGRSRKGRADLLRTLTADLTTHELMEEQVLYPALKAHPEAKDIVLEGFQEHHVADILVKELHDVSTDDEQWGAKFKVLKESLEHHISEEEGAMFRTARAVFSHDELHELGTRMQKLRAGARRT